MLNEHINTDGQFEFRIKPRIEHGSAFLNRAIEEMQQIIVANKDSANVFLARIKAMEEELSDLKKASNG